MERRQPGRPRNAPGHGRLLLWTLGYTLTAFVLLSLHGEAFAAQLVDVRVGEHKGYTRLVLELDSLAAYQVSEPRGDGDSVMTVQLEARGSAQELTPLHPIVKGVRVETVGKGTTIHVQLLKAEVQINEMILLSPPRLVFDIRDPAAAAAKRTAKPVVPAKAAPAPAQKAVVPTTLKPSATTAAVAKTPPAPKPAAAAGAPVSEGVAVAGKPENASAVAKVAVGQLTPTEKTVAVSEASPSNAMGEPRPADPSAHPAASEVADYEAANPAPGHPLALDGAATGRPNAMAIAPTAADTKLAVPPLPSQRRAAAGGPEVPASSGGDGFVAKAKGFVSGINKIVLVGVGAVIVLFLFFVIRRGRVGDDALSPVMSADHLGSGDDDLFGGPADVGATEPVPTTRSVSAPRPPPMPAPAASDGALESRVAELENTLVQLAQARENMERQLAAQTEELRVQRAAIARTQRVVRSFGEGDEDSSGATEPVPRVPAS